MGAAGPPPAITVIIPTYNRSSALLECLAHLERQCFREFEVVTVNDGSTDGTQAALAVYAGQTQLAMRCLRQANSGPARARNRAIQIARAPICLMIGDDIFASPQLVETHFKLHQDRPERRVAGLGFTRWSEQGQIVTPFMRWLDETGEQFAYGNLFGGMQADWRHFYTSNLSLKTALLRENPFDEEFRGAAMEDIELGYRLYKQHGLEVVFLPEAAAAHLHPTTVRRACLRALSVGAATFQFAQRWPEQTPPFPKTSNWRRRLRESSAAGRLGIPLLRFGASLLTRVRCPNPLLSKAMAAHSALGYRRAKAGQTRQKG